MNNDKNINLPKEYYPKHRFKLLKLIKSPMAKPKAEMPLFEISVSLFDKKLITFNLNQ